MVDERGLDAPDGNERSKGNRTLGQMQSPLPLRILKPNAAAASGGIQNISIFQPEYLDISTKISRHSNQNINRLAKMQ